MLSPPRENHRSVFSSSSHTDGQEQPTPPRHCWLQHSMGCCSPQGAALPLCMGATGCRRGTGRQRPSPGHGTSRILSFGDTLGSAKAAFALCVTTHTCAPLAVHPLPSLARQIPKHQPSSPHVVPPAQGTAWSCPTAAGCWAGPDGAPSVGKLVWDILCPTVLGSRNAQAVPPYHRDIPKIPDHTSLARRTSWNSPRPLAAGLDHSWHLF